MQKRILSVSSLVVALLLVGFSIGHGAERGKIAWLTIEEAIEKAKKEPRPILMDVYTDWCGWCTRMDAYTFTNPTISDYISKNFYAVKFNSEMKEKVSFRGKEYAPHQGEGRGPHSLVVSLTNGRLSYPTIVYLTAVGELVTVVPGYYAPRDLEPILHFIVEEAYLTNSWEEFQKSFKGSI